MTSEIKTIATKRQVVALCWNGDQLVDSIDSFGGWTTYSLDGSEKSGGVRYAYRFDSVAVSPSGRFKVLYEKLGTKGLILDGHKLLREINRSFYQAHVYEYPIVLFQLPDGREVVAHCPDDYNKLEIEELETGKHLTQRDNEPEGLFHSRLAVSGNGKYLISAGWMWHSNQRPFGWFGLYDIEKAFSQPIRFDVSSLHFSFSSSEINNACFLSDTISLVHSSVEAEDFDEGESEEERRSPMRPGTFGFVDLSTKKLTRTVPVSAEIGTMFALDGKHVLGVYEHPKVINIESGEVVESWPELQTGKQNSSTIHHIEKHPPMAFDKANRRFAVADEKSIHILTIPRYD